MNKIVNQIMKKMKRFLIKKNKISKMIMKKVFFLY